MIVMFNHQTGTTVEKYSEMIDMFNLAVDEFVIIGDIEITMPIKKALMQLHPQEKVECEEDGISPIFYALAGFPGDMMAHELIIINSNMNHLECHIWRIIDNCRRAYAHCVAEDDFCYFRLISQIFNSLAKLTAEAYKTDKKVELDDLVSLMRAKGQKFLEDVKC